jgi:hypothetical protein
MNSYKVGRRRGGAGGARGTGGQRWKTSVVRQEADRQPVGEELKKLSQ